MDHLVIPEYISFVPLKRNTFDDLMDFLTNVRYIEDERADMEGRGRATEAQDLRSRIIKEVLES
jgi:hypothetical protein